MSESTTSRKGKAKAKDSRKGTAKGKASRKGKAKGKAALSEEAQEERAQKKEEKKKKKVEALEPSIANPEGMVSNEFSLGWGLCSVLLPHLGGKGPTVVLGPLQRPKQTKAMDRLIEICGESGEHLLRADSKHALTFGVNPDILDLTSLSSNPKGPFQLVNWKDGAVDQKVTMYAGYHRTELLKDKVLKKTWDEYKRVEKQLKKHPSNGKHQQDMKVLENVLYENGTWLVEFVDALTPLKEKFRKDLKKGQTVLLQLSSNNRVSSHPDTPIHHFNNIARTLAWCKDPDDRTTLLAFAMSELPGDVSTLLLKHKDLVELLALVHNIPAFAANGLTPNQLLEAKKTFWGVLEPFIRGGYYQLLYLTASAESVDEESPSNLSQSVANWFTHHSDGTPNKEITAQSLDQLGSSVIRNRLVEIFDQAFKEHLDKVMDYFGLPQSMTWSKAMISYEKQVKRDVEAFILKQVGAEDSNDEEVEAEDLDEQDLQILQAVPKKLDRLMEQQLMTCFPFLPDMHSKVPMPSPSFLRALYHLLKQLSPVLSLATISLKKQISLWMFPGLSDFKAQRTGSRSKSTGEVATPSETCLILHHLSYFQYLDAPDKDWAHLDFPTSGMVYWTPESNSHSATAEVAQLWLQFIAFVLNNRIVVLMHRVEIEKGLKVVPPKLNSDYQTITSETIKEWCNEAYQTEKKQAQDLKKGETLLRFMQTCPTKLYKEDESHPFTKHIGFRRGFQWSTFNFLVTPNNNNNDAMRLRYAGALWGDYKLLKRLVYPDVLLVFRSTLRTLIVLTKGMEKWQFWFQYSSDHRDILPFTLPATTDEDVKKMLRAFKNAKNHAILTGAFIKIARNLNVEGVCGIPKANEDEEEDEEDEEGEEDNGEGTLSKSLGLHPALSAEDIYEDLTAISNKDDTYEPKAVTWDEASNEFPMRGIPISFASERDVQKVYGKNVKLMVNPVHKKKQSNSEEKRPAEEDTDDRPAKKQRRLEQEVEDPEDGPEDPEEDVAAEYPPNQLAQRGALRGENTRGSVSPVRGPPAWQD
ncbi:hypothetical protein B0H11DRAFT_1929497 [Mycena galericulata]|nr:hypothetical protein B0H11DRAFT_1929497 [Mycena galericulata]